MIQISDKIEKMVFAIHQMTKDGETTLLDAVVEYCGKNNIEVEAAAEIINDIPYLKSQFRDIAKARNLVE